MRRPLVRIMTYRSDCCHNFEFENTSNSLTFSPPRKMSVSTRQKISPLTTSELSDTSAPLQQSQQKNVVPPTHTSSTDSSSRIRSRYLHRLGVGSESDKRTMRSRSPIKAIGQCSWQSVKSTSETTSVSTTRATATFVPLKTDNGKRDETITIDSPPRSSTASSSSGVSFQSSVTVHDIPSHTTYSCRVRQTLWMDRQELEQSVTRNALEFASENWDWRQAVEETDMILMKSSSSTEHYLVHPIHVLVQQQRHQHRHLRPCNLQNQFLKVMCAQRAGV